MASGAARVYTGAFVGTGVALSVEKVGFRPNRVELINVDDPNLVIMTDTMDDDTGFKQKAGVSAMIGANGVTLTDTGFDVGTDADLNTLGETVHFTAWG